MENFFLNRPLTKLLSYLDFRNPINHTDCELLMVRHHGYRTKTRRLYKKKCRARGLPGLSRFMVDYENGDKVDIIGDPSFQKRGLPHRRFFGKTGVIVGSRGRCYEVDVKDGNKTKTLFIGREHIRINKDYLTIKEKPAASKAE